MPKADSVKIVHTNAQGNKKVLKESLELKVLPVCIPYARSLTNPNRYFT